MQNQNYLQGIREDPSFSKGNKYLLKNTKDICDNRDDINIINNLKAPKEHKDKWLKILIIIFYISLVYLIFSSLVVKCDDRQIEMGESFIILKTKGKGDISILSSGYSGEKPNEIFINNTKIDEIKKQYFFNISENDIIIIKLLWNEEINTTYNIFNECINIIEINLSNFNTQKVTNMGYMFSYCSKLTSLDLSNFNTVNVTNMEYMFSDCKELNSLDLSNFNTLKLKICNLCLIIAYI